MLKLSTFDKVMPPAGATVLAFDLEAADSVRIKYALMEVADNGELSRLGKLSYSEPARLKSKAAKDKHYRDWHSKAISQPQLGGKSHVWWEVWFTHMRNNNLTSLEIPYGIDSDKQLTFIYPDMFWTTAEVVQSWLPPELAPNYKEYLSLLSSALGE